MTAIIIDGKVYTAEMGHPDCLALCRECDLRDYCEQTDREVCSAIAEATDHFRFDQALTDKINEKES